MVQSGVALLTPGAWPSGVEAILLEIDFSDWRQPTPGIEETVQYSTLWVLGSQTKCSFRPQGCDHPRIEMA